MRLLLAFFRLVRWPNLFFIGLTQSLFYFFVQKRVLHGMQGVSFGDVYPLTPRLFGSLCLSSVLIAAAGYIINDYFDLDIDRVNKPEKLVVDRIIKRRWTIVWHWILSGLGILLGCYVSWRLRNPVVCLANIGCVILLWFYSTTFKRKLLIGNLIISLLTAWVILVLYVSEFRFVVIRSSDLQTIQARLFKFTILYGGFAFIISLVREVVKDIEDLGGDVRYGCRTMPVVWGVNTSKVFAGTWLLVLTGSLAVIQVYILQYGWWPVVIYSVLLLIWPLIRILRSLYRAQAKAEYHRISSLIKAVMLAGILSMALIEFV
jgi:4-hydroxybenzoate polyprenyltransferase